jgi:hypothetical protein
MQKALSETTPLYEVTAKFPPVRFPTVNPPRPAANHPAPNNHALNAPAPSNQSAARAPQTYIYNPSGFAGAPHYARMSQPRPPYQLSYFLLSPANPNPWQPRPADQNKFVQDQISARKDLNQKLRDAKFMPSPFYKPIKNLLGPAPYDGIFYLK